MHVQTPSQLARSTIEVGKTDLLVKDSTSTQVNAIAVWAKCWREFGQPPANVKSTVWHFGGALPVP